MFILCTSLQASACHKDGDLEQAERLYKKALDLRPQNADLHHQFGALLVQRYKTGEVRLHISDQLTRWSFELNSNSYALFGPERSAFDLGDSPTPL